jgi:Zn finger protein HypA/HybF involved in hydrogenase expression
MPYQLLGGDAVKHVSDEKLKGLLDHCDQAIRFAEQMDAYIELARRGEARCPDCGALRPALTPETEDWTFVCDNCRGDDE